MHLTPTYTWIYGFGSYQRRAEYKGAARLQRGVPPRRAEGRPGQERRQAGGGQVRRAAPQPAARLPAGGAAQGQEGEEAELGEPRRLSGPRHRALHAQLRPRQAHARCQPREGPEAVPRRNRKILLRLIFNFAVSKHE